MSTNIHMAANKVEPEQGSDKSLTFEVVRVPAADKPDHDMLKQQCYDIRVQVFMRERGFPIETEFDDVDDIASHFLLRVLPSYTPAGTIRVVRGADFYKLSRLAVLKPYRSIGFGRALVLAVHDWALNDARSSGAQSGDVIKVMAHSSIPATKFYAKYGYKPEGEEFADEDGALNQKMVARMRMPVGG